jgi:hypothetical protein
LHDSTRNDGLVALVCHELPQAQVTVAVTYSGWMVDFISVAFLLLLPNGLDVQCYLDVVADDRAAGLDHLVPADVELLAADLCRGRERSSAVAPGVVDLAVVVDVEDDGPGDVADGQVTVDLRALVVDALNAGALKVILGTARR